MPVNTLSHSQYQIMPWKNGQGTTAQILIYPQNAVFPGGDFLWRLSSATVKVSGPFSLFPGCERLLVVLQGEGLRLNGHELLPFRTLKFSGELHIQGDLIGGTVVDLGLIYRADKVQAQMDVIEKAPETLKLNPSVKTHLFFRESGDCLMVEGEKEIALKSMTSEREKLIHIQITF